jgi:viroplasmin and RNaseH domain-containing protein
MITKTKTTIYTANWVKFDFVTYDEGFIRGRSRMKDKLDKCFGCNSKLKIGDKVNLANFGKHGNKVLCFTCAKDIENKLEQARLAEVAV